LSLIILIPKCRQKPRLVVQKIVSRALQNGVPLSEVERKMLLFSETSPTLPDIAEVNDAFDRDYDRLEYENKMALVQILPNEK
jgi:hypothetical protein